MEIKRSESMECQSEVPQPAVQSPPRVCIDRVEQARAEERAYAGERSAPAEKLYGLLKQVPTPGVLELEVQGKVLHNGGKAKVTAARDESGDYLIRIAGEASVAVPLPASVAVNGGAAATYRVRTPEAAADLLQALVLTFAAPGALQAGDALRTAHYADQSLERVDLSLELVASAHFAPAVQMTGLEGAYGSVGYVDFKKHLFVTEVVLGGEVLTRGSVIAARAGIKGEVSMKLRTELELPDDVLARLASGELSAAEFIRSSEATRKLVFESEARGEIHTLFAPGSEYVKKFEAEMDLDEFFSNPLEPGNALKGHVKTMVASQRAAGVGFDAAGSGFLVRGAVYDVTEQPLFHGHDDGALQKELDLKRSLSR